MEQLGARLETIQRVDGDLYLATLSVITCWPTEDFEGVDQRTYRVVEIDTDGRTMTPKDDLQECFDVHHKFEYGYGLNPKLRRQWKTASLIGGIVRSPFQVRPARSLGPSARD